MFHNTIFLTHNEILGNVEHAGGADPNTFHPGVIVTLGWKWVQYLKRFFFSGSLYTAATSTTTTTTTTTAGDKSEAKETGEDVHGNGNCDPCTGKLLRRTELPLYGEEYAAEEKRDEKDPCNLEKGISIVRKEVWILHDKYEGYREKIVEVVTTGKEHSSKDPSQAGTDEHVTNGGKGTKCKSGSKSERDQLATSEKRSKCKHGGEGETLPNDEDAASTEIVKRESDTSEKHKRGRCDTDRSTSDKSGGDNSGNFREDDHGDDDKQINAESAGDDIKSKCKCRKILCNCKEK